jgi:hypothetical protein
METLEHRLKLLKHFNHCVVQLIPLIDLRNLYEERSLASCICNLKGLLFYDVKARDFVYSYCLQYV